MHPDKTTVDYVAVPETEVRSETVKNEDVVREKVRTILAALREEYDRRYPANPPLDVSARILSLQWGIVTAVVGLLAAGSSVWIADRNMRPSPVMKQVTTNAEQPQLVQMFSVAMRDGMPEIMIMGGKHERHFTTADAIGLQWEDGTPGAWVGKYTENHEWILLRSKDTDHSMLFLCPEEGLYVECGIAACSPAPRSEFLRKTVVREFLAAFPPLVSGSRTPAAWGRDTSYGGKRGVERINRLIAELRKESDALASRDE